MISYILCIFAANSFFYVYFSTKYLTMHRIKNKVKCIVETPLKFKNFDTLYRKNHFGSKCVKKIKLFFSKNNYVHKNMFNKKKKIILIILNIFVISKPHTKIVL